MELDDVHATSLSVEEFEEDLALVDRWALSRLQSTIISMTDDISAYRQDRAIGTLLDFVIEDVSRFYIQEVRERMWLETDAPEKSAAYATLATILETVTRLLAPFAPFLADHIHGILTDRQTAVTVHALDWPTPEPAYHDEALEADVAAVRKIEEAAATARQQAGRKLRWPIQRLVVETDEEGVASAARRREELLCDRLNAKALEVVTPQWEELLARAEPRMAEIGPAYGEQAEAIMDAVRGRPVSEVRDGIEVDGTHIDLTDEMFDIEHATPDQVVGAEFEGGRVYVDAQLTPELEAEAYAREVVRRIQEMRKDLDLDIEETVLTSLAIEDGDVEAYVETWREYIARETRTSEFVDHAGAAEETWDVEGVTIEIGIEPTQE